MRFAEPLESQYLRHRLLESHTIIRVASVAGVALTGLRGLDQAIEGAWSGVLWMGIAAVMAISVLLTILAWSPRFERLYPHWAKYVVPSRNALIAIQIAAAAARGQVEMLIAMPITFIGPFFFLGLPLPTSLVCAAATAVTYAISAAAFGLPATVAFRADVLLFGGIVACVIAVWNLEKTARLSFLEGGFIAELAQRDALTGTKNRRVFDEHLEQIWRHAIDETRTMAILLIDIDHFKAYNDHYGHQAGDQTLCAVAQAVQKTVFRPLDILTRYGGEEFAVILYDINEQQARATADRMCRSITELNIEHRASKTAPRVTISVGVAAIQPTPDRTPRGAIQLADQALYQAKVRGRNRVEVMDDAQHRMLVTGVFAIHR
jgi:diguanylate cyclase (GGDEF)-like protein